MTANRQVVVSAPGTVEIQHTVVPDPGPGEILVRMRVVGICGSDVHAAHGRHPFVPLPYQPGHEIVGVVEAVGPDVRTPIGTRGIVEPILACGHCKYCTDGRYNLCNTMSFFGCTTTIGGLADLFLIPADRLIPVPDTLGDLQAVLVEPLSTPVHAVALAGGDLTGKTVAILGAGTIGLLTLLVCRGSGAERIAVSDISSSKRDLAAQLGADSVFDAADPGLVDAVRADLGTSADIVFDCVSIQATIDQAIGIARKGGTVVVVGVPAAPVTVPLPEIQDLQVRIQGSATYTRPDIDRAIQMIGSGVVDADTFISAQYPFDQAAQAFQDASSGRQIKVVVRAAEIS